MKYSPEVASRIIGQIYDCAIDPDQWPSVLMNLRAEMGLAYAKLYDFDYRAVGPDMLPGMTSHQTDWDRTWIGALPSVLHTCPGIHAFLSADTDAPVSQMQMFDEAEFQRSSFYEAWVRPQGLRDVCNSHILRRQGRGAMLCLGAYADRALFDADDRRLMALLTPHMRRVMMIAEMTQAAEGRAQLSGAALDLLACAVALVEASGRVVYANAEAEALLSRGDILTLRDGVLRPRASPRAAAFMEALARACEPEDGARSGRATPRCS